jgi:hypothetical protein
MKMIFFVILIKGLLCNNRFADFIVRRDSSDGAMISDRLTTENSIPGRVQNGPGDEPVLYPIGTGKYSPGVKRQGTKDDESPPSRTEVKNGWRYTSTT